MVVPDFKGIIIAAILLGAVIGVVGFGVGYLIFSNGAN